MTPGHEKQAGAQTGVAMRSRLAWWQRGLRAVNPGAILSGIPGAVFEKEVRVSGRKMATYLVRGGFTLLMTVFCLLIVLANVDDARYMGGTAASLQQLQEIAPWVMVTLGWCLFIGLTLVAVTRASVAICDERRAGTLSALMTTPLLSWQIVLGKLLSTMVELVILGLLALPLLFAVRAFGGLPADVILRVTAITLMHALLGASLAMLFSINARRSSSALFMALFSLALLEAGPGMVMLGVEQILEDAGVSIDQLWEQVSPYTLGLKVSSLQLFLLGASPLALAVTMFEGLGSGTGLVGVSDAVFRWHLGYLGFWMVVTFFNSVVLLRRRLASDAAGATGAPSPSQGGSKSRTVGDAPVLWRELSQSALPKRWHLPVIIVVVVALFSFLYWKVGVKQQSVHFMTMAITSIMAICLAAIGTTGGITTERESRTWETLLTTPLSAKEIIMGKFFGAVRRQWLVPAILGTHIVLGGLLPGVLRLNIIFFAPLVLLSALILLSASGVLFSLMFRRTSTASSINFLFAFFLWAILPALLAIFSGFLRTTFAREVLEKLAGGLLCFNPVAMGIMVMGAALDESPMVRGGSYDLFGIFRVNELGFSAIVLGTSIVNLVGAKFMLRTAEGLLARQAGRHR